MQRLEVSGAVRPHRLQRVKRKKSQFAVPIRTFPSTAPLPTGQTD